MDKLKLTRETLEDGTFRYALLCDGHVTDFKKDPKPYDYAQIHESRIIGLTNTPNGNTVKAEILTETATN